MGDDEVALTSDQIITWAYNSVQLTKPVIKYFASKQLFSSYQMITRDICELLTVEEHPSESRFTDLENDPIEAAILFAHAIRHGPFEETTEGSGQWRQLSDLEMLDDYMPQKLQLPMTVVYKGSEIELSPVGATLYLGQMSLLTHVQMKFGKLLPDRVRQSALGARPKGVARRKELELVFTAITAAELKKAVKAVGLDEGTKSDMVQTLLNRYAPKRTRKRKAVEVEAVAVEDDGEEEEEEEEDGAE